MKIYCTDTHIIWSSRAPWSGPQDTKIWFYIFYLAYFVLPRNSSNLICRGIHTPLIFSNLQFNRFLLTRSVHTLGDKNHIARYHGTKVTKWISTTSVYWSQRKFYSIHNFPSYWDDLLRVCLIIYVKIAITNKTQELKRRHVQPIIPYYTSRIYMQKYNLWEDIKI